MAPMMSLVRHLHASLDPRPVRLIYRVHCPERIAYAEELAFVPKFERARDDLQRAIDVNPDIAGYHEKLGTVLRELEDWEGAQERFARGRPRLSGGVHLTVGALRRRGAGMRNRIRCAAAQDLIHLLPCT